MSEGKAPGVGDPAPDFTLKTIGLKDVSPVSYTHLTLPTIYSV